MLYGLASSLPPGDSTCPKEPVYSPGRTAVAQVLLTQQCVFLSPPVFILKIKLSALNFGVDVAVGWNNE